MSSSAAAARLRQTKRVRPIARRTSSSDRLIQLALFASIVLCLSCQGTGPKGVVAQPQAAADCFRRIVTVLADDSMEGRGVGTAGLERAALFLEEEFHDLGLQDAGVAYQQAFRVETGVAAGVDNSLQWRSTPASGWTDEEFGRGFTALGFSSSLEFSGPLVFAGYGIRAEPLGYDDYADTDVSGKVVLAMRYEPGEDDPDSPFDGRRPSRWSDLRYKALAAREAGAAALIFVSPTAEGDEEPNRLPLIKNEILLSRAGLPVLQVTPAVADRWLAAAGYSLAQLRDAIDSDFTPRSFEIPSARVRGRTDVLTSTAPVRNIVGVRPGRGSLAGESIVIGAHYDHLGFGGAGSLEPDVEAVHNGADDNASGVAAMLCAVQRLSPHLRANTGDERALIVLAFAAEEIGLGGSAHYVQNAIRPLDTTMAMVNLDMVGRLRDGRLSALGSESSTDWDALLAGLVDETNLVLSTGGDGYGPSDQMAFYQREVPVIHIFTGAHSEYHTPADDVETLNIAGGGQVSTFVEDLLADLLTRRERLPYRASGSAPTMGGDSRGYGAYMGSIPDYSTMGAREGGVLLAGVRGGGPAGRAGLRGGDTIVEMAGIQIHNLYDMTFVLREHRPGETISVTVTRDGERVAKRVTLGRRGASPASDSHESHSGESWTPESGVAASHLLDEQEVHLADLRQLTFDGENAEAYFSPDGRSLIFQRTAPGAGCDQQYLMDLTTGDTTRLSSGYGRTTCGYFAYPDGDRLIYATTENVDDACPEKPDRSRGYVWGLYDFDLVWQQGPGQSKQTFVSVPGAYDAEATACMRDGRIVFTSTRDGDLDLYVVDADGSDLKRLTNTPGYDGGAFFTPDCAGIVFRASRPTGTALKEYRSLLADGLVRPDALDIYWMDSDGGNVRRLTDNGAANFAPYPTPDGAAVLFASNLGGSDREFDLYRLGRDGGEPEQITFAAGFDAFPMFSPDGRWLVFASNRAGGHQTNIFIARWLP
ncbi:MAG: M28 family peptidase [Myxococcota bacterium]